MPEGARRALPPSLAAAAFAALACTGAGAQSWRITPGISVGETWSDNLRLVADAEARSGWVTDVSPSLRIENPVGTRVHVFADYGLHALFYPKDAGGNTTQHFLDSLARYEAIDRTLFFDARAGMGLQSRTPFATTLAPNAPGAVDERVQTRTWRLASLLRGDVGAFALYTTQYAYSELRTDDPSVPKASTQHWTGQLRSPSGGRRIGWTVDAEALQMRREDDRARDNARVRASVLISVLPQLTLALSEGYENTNMAGDERQGDSMPGVGLTWTPSERTQFATLHERRFFGAGHVSQLSHRTARTIWRITSSRQVSALPEALVGGSGASLSQLLQDLLASSIPDPQARADAVARRFDRSGLVNSSPLDATFLTVRPVIDRRFEATAAWLLPRDALNLSATRTEQRALGAAANDAFALSDNIRRTGFSASLAHNLTPLTAINLTASRLRTEALDDTALASVQRLASLRLSTQLGPRTFVSLGVRHVRFDSAVEGAYRENAVFATVAVRL